MVSVATLLLPFLLISGEQILSTFTPMLDPNRIAWWKTKWAPAPIVLSVNNKDRNEVVATFFVSLSTPLSSGLLEVTFPAGFSLSSSASQSVVGLTVQLAPQSLSASDLSFSISSITNPAKAGPYGPFAIRTRAFPNGQQIDANLSFGTVYITAAPGMLGSPTVTLAGSVVNKAVNKGGNTLSFKFTIGVSLWRYDTFVVMTDQKWTIAMGATCSSADYAGRWNNFNGSNSANPHVLNCIVVGKTFTSGQTIYIYGLSVDGIDVTLTNDNKYIDLRIAGVTTPPYVYVDNLYSWTIATYRFGTGTILETGSVASGPVVSPDGIGTVVWTPTWGMLPSDLPMGSSFFMDLSFTLTNPLPSSGSIEILVTEDVSTGDPAWTALPNCYIVTYFSRNTVCTVTTNSITITGVPDVAAGKVVKVRNVVKVTSTPGSTAKINSIKTYQGPISSGVLIDSGSNLSSFKIPDTTSKLSTFSIRFHDTTTTAVTPIETAGGTGDYKLGIQFTIIPSPIVDLTSVSAVTVSCPFTQGGDDWTIGVPAVSYWYKDDVSTSPIDMFTGRVSLSTPLPTLVYGTATNSQGTLSFAGSIGTVAGGMHLLMYQTSSVSSFITLPRVVNNLGTAYECRASVVTPSKTTHRGAFRFSISPQTWSENSFKLPCTSNIDGMPGIFSIKPSILPIPASSPGLDYYIEIEFAGAGNFNSGLVLTPVNTSNKEDVLYFAVDYPHSTSATGTTNAKLYTNAGSGIVAVTGFGSLATTGASLVVYFPIGGWATPGTLSPTARSFSLLSSDPRFKSITHQSPLTSVTTVTPAANFPTALPVSASNSFVNGETVPTPGLLLNLSASTLLSTDHYFYIVLPAGYTWTSSPSITNTVGGSTPYTNVKYFSGSSAGFRYSGALVGTMVGGSVKPLPDTQNAAGTLVVGGFRSPLGAASSTLSLVLGSTPISGACINTKTDFPLTSKPGTITNVQIFPDNSKSRGPDGVAVTHTISFTLPHGVPAGGIVMMTVAADWEVTGSTRCVGSGVAPVLGGKLNCGISGRTLSLTNFADFSLTPSSQISIQIANLLPPLSASSTPYVFLTALSTSTGITVIDELTVFTNSAVIVSASSLFSSIDWQRISTIPPTPSSKSVDLYLRFSLSHSIPPGGVIAITSPLPFKYSSTAKNFCFVSPLQYSDCGVSAGVLEITLGQGYLAKGVVEVYLDEAVDNPAGTGSMTTGFTITSKWSGVIIDSDTGAVQASQTLKTASVPVGILTAISLSISPSSACELSSYSFSFTNSSPFSPSDQYLFLFPQQFDYYLGDVFPWFSTDPYSYNIDCVSDQLPSVLCTVDHNIVILTSSSGAAANSVIKVTVSGVRNPGVGTTGQFQVYHIDASGGYIGVNQSFGTVTTKSMAENIEIRSLDVSNIGGRSVATYKWRVYLADTVETDCSLMVEFPKEYDLMREDKKDKYTCGSTWLDNAINSTIKTAQNWNPGTVCVTQENRISLPPPATAMTFTPTKILSLTLESVMTPYWSFPRSSVSLPLDFDITDHQIWSNSNLIWTSKFQFFIYRNNTNVYSSRSYSNTNSAYAGFTLSRRPITVNNYQPGNKSGRIVVYAGTQTSDLSVSTGSDSQPMAAKQVMFTPTTNSRTPDGGRIKYTSKRQNWTMVSGQYWVKFRVAAAIDTPKGLFYIDWAISETKQAGGNEALYDPPVNTLVEVIQKTQGKYNFVVGQTIGVMVGFQSVPIRVGVSNAPHSEVRVGISVVEGGTDLIITPSILIFSPDVNELYFQVQVAPSYSQGDFQTLQFSLSGIDAYSYQPPASLKIPISPKPSNISPGSILDWVISDPSRTNVTITPSIDQPGIVYYYLSPVGSNIPSFSSLKSAISTQNATTPPIETDPRTGETWTDFQHRLYRQHLQSQWSGSIAMPITSTTGNSFIAVDWLAGGTNYQVAGYLDNLGGGEDPGMKVKTLRTKEVAECQPFVVKFVGLVAKSFQDVLIRELSKIQGVDPRRIQANGYTTFRRRSLQTISSTVFSFIMLSDRYVDNPTPTEQAKISDSGKAQLSITLKSAGISNALTDVSNGDMITKVTPQWIVTPKATNTTEETAVVELKANVAGTQCCVALLDSAASPLPSQVMSCLSPSNQPVPCSCLPTDLSTSLNSLTIKALTPKTQYYLYCSATDNYPLWPTYMEYGAGKTWSPVAVSTAVGSNTGEMSNGGMELVVELLIVIIEAY